MAERDSPRFRLTSRTHEVEPIALPPVDAEFVRETRERLRMSRQVFAFKIGVNPRTLERWEQGRSKPNEQAVALIWLVRKFPDTLDRLESLTSRCTPVAPCGERVVAGRTHRHPPQHGAGDLAAFPGGQTHGITFNDSGATDFRSSVAHPPRRGSRSSTAAAGCP